MVLSKQDILQKFLIDLPRKLFYPKGVFVSQRSPGNDGESQEEDSVHRGVQLMQEQAERGKSRVSAEQDRLDHVRLRSRLWELIQEGQV